MKNKNGSAVTNVLFVVAIIALLFVGYGIAQSQFDFGGFDKPSSNTCSLDSVITVSSLNALNKGAADISPTIKVSIDGGVPITVTSGTTKLTAGSNAKLFLSKANYIDTVTEEFVVPCGPFTKQVFMYDATAGVGAIEIWNDDGDKMTDSITGGAVNQTALSAGEAFTETVKIRGTNLQSTGDLIVVVEVPTAANITDVTLSGATKLNYVSSVHATQLAGSKVVAFKIPAIVGAITSTHDLTITLGSGKIISGGVYLDYYAEQFFIDDDGSLVKGIQDSTGDAQYENAGDSDFYINAA